jgi:hypothetical protein
LSTETATVLIGALRRLDERLATALDVLGERQADRFRGLYLRDEDIRAALGTEPLGGTLFPAWELGAAAAPALGPVRDAFALDLFELDVLLIALAPELDLRYERIYAYLQDDVSRRRPSVDLAVSLLAQDPVARLRLRSRLARSLLLRAGLVALGEPERPFLARPLVPDATVVAAVLGEPQLDARLDGHCSFEPVPAGRARAGVPEAARIAAVGRSAAARLAVARDVALSVGAPLLRCDTDAGTLRTAALEAALRGAVLYVADPEQAAAAVCLPHPAVVVAASRERIAGAIALEAVPPGYAARRASWAGALRGSGAPARAASAAAARFELELDTIALAAGDARAHAAIESRPPALGDLLAAARAHARAPLGGLAQRIEPRRTWSDLVLPDGQVGELRALCRRVVNRHRVLEEWGFAGRLTLGTGTTALFTGSSGTGKTLAAEVVAHELGLDLFRIDLAAVVSKYIGETEKNLARVFDAAEGSSAILFFDEADALFGKRSEVRDSHDRYANIEISFLLQRMEAYSGVAILATNLRDNLDPAFARRLAFIIPFPYPDADQRREIWRRIWPSETPLDAALDLDAVATRFQLTGGEIKNVALTAAFLAADASSPVAPGHLVQALRTEYRKVGKSLSDAELGGAAA